MKKLFLSCLAAAVAFLNLGYASSLAADNEFEFDFSLPAPASEHDQALLGLSAGKSFTLAQLEADVLLIQIFSMYCPICQREAENTNRIYDMIKTKGYLDKGIRMIGIGAGNSDFEADFFKENYKIEFPLFSDADFTVHKKVKEVGTPHFFLLKRDNNSALKLVFSHSGEVPEPEVFFEKILELSGLGDRK